MALLVLSSFDFPLHSTVSALDDIRELWPLWQCVLEALVGTGCAETGREKKGE